MDFTELLAEYIRNTDRDDIPKIWASLCNIDWVKGDEVISFSFRAAGGFIADVLGGGTYMDWYCSSPVMGVSGIPPLLAEYMALDGWTPIDVECGSLACAIDELGDMMDGILGDK